MNDWLSILKATFFASMLVLAGCATNDNKISETPKQDTIPAKPSSFRDSALDIGIRTAAWQLSRMDNFDYVRTHLRSTRDTKDWVQGAFYVGATRWAETVNDKNIQAKIAEMAKSNGYELGRRPLHGDDHVIGQSYLWLYEQTGNKETYAPIQAQFDAILADQPTNSLEFLKKDQPGYEGSCQDRWCWADALFMAPRTWLKLSNATGDPRYFDYADKEYWATVDYLFSDKYGLFFRDSRYFEKKSDNGEPVFWSRGNGWVFAAMPLIIDDLPKGHPSTDRYLALYRKMAASLVKIQKPDGYWPASLMDADKVKTPETSGTGFITFGLAWGVNNGIITNDATINAVEQGWAALAAAVDNEGMLHWVQQVGKSPDPVLEDDTQLYGVGAVLLAASELSKWKTEEERKTPIAYGRFVPERDDDFTWENDKVAFRVYGPAGPKKGTHSGVDNWFKSVDYPVINKWYPDYLNGISYHKNKGEGYDPYHVGNSRGTGGSAIWIEGKPYAANTYSSYKVIKSGADEVVFSIQSKWQTPLGLVVENKTISLALGEQLYRANSVFTLDGVPASLPIAVGLTTHDEVATVSVNKKTGRISTWENFDALGLGTGALVEPAIIKKIKHIPSKVKDESHVWIITSSDDNGELTYRAGFAWEAAGDIKTSKQWNTYLDTRANK